MHIMTADTWRAIWQRIDDRRIELGVSWKRIEREGNVSQRTLYKMRDDGTELKSPAKRSSLSRALGWSSDSIDRLLNGQEPLAADRLIAAPHERVEAAAQWDETMRRIKRDFRDQLLAHIEDEPTDSPLRQAYLQLVSNFEAKVNQLEGWVVMQMTMKELREAVEYLAPADPEQFAIAAEGADGRAPADPGRRVSRPQPEVEDD